MNLNHNLSQSFMLSDSFMPMFEAHRLWRIADALHFHCWGEEYVVYHALSGNTHLIGKAAADILIALQQHTADTQSLSRSLAAMMGVRTSAEFMLEMNRILADLSKLSLIEHR